MEKVKELLIVTVLFIGLFGFLAVIGFIDEKKRKYEPSHPKFDGEEEGAPDENNSRTITGERYANEDTSHRALREE